MAPRIWSWRDVISRKLITGRAGRSSGSSHAQGPSAIAACWRAPGWRVALDVVFLQHFGHSCSAMLLVAAPLGEPVYRRLGFRKTADYVFMDVPRLPHAHAGQLHRGWRAVEGRNRGSVVSRSPRRLKPVALVITTVAIPSPGYTRIRQWKPPTPPSLW